MRYFKKNTPPSSLTQWLTDYKDALESRYNNLTKDIAVIWEELGEALDKTELTEIEIAEAQQRKDVIHSEFESSLLHEQGFICCYCGKRIPENKMVREHFKDKKDNRKLVFQYTNLFASCEGGKITSYSIGEKVNLQDGSVLEIKGIKEVVKILNQNLPNISSTDIENYPKNKNRTFNKGDKIYFPNPPHCDTAKGSKTDTIIDPSQQEGCEYWFIYREVGGTIDIDVLPLKNSPYSELVQTTIDILKLKVDTLKKNTYRQRAYKNGIDKVSEIQQTLIELFDNDEDRISFVKDMIENEIYAKTDDKLDPFCFVTASVIWNSFF